MDYILTMLDYSHVMLPSGLRSRYPSVPKETLYFQNMTIVTVIIVELNLKKGMYRSYHTKIY